MSALLSRLLGLAAIAALSAVVASPTSARPPSYGGGYNNGGYHHDYENRRDARRAGVVAGVVTAGVVGAAGSARADDKYQECREEAYYDSGRYPPNCEAQRYNDQRNARRSAVVTGVVVGSAARAIVRN